MDLPSIRTAQARIAPYVRHTPLEPSPSLSRELGVDVSFKMECWQVTGSFKLRISFSKLLSLDEAQRRRGVVASTAGGHGIGLSYAAQALGVPCTICLPRAADPFKVRVIERQGARLCLHATIEEGREHAQEMARTQGLTFVSAYNDPEVIAGDGTVGLELLADAPQLDLVVVGMGGGGMAAGIGIALKESGAKARVWGVQPEANAVLARWLEEGEPVEVPPGASIAEGLGARIERDSRTFPLAQRYVDRTLLVSEADIRDAMLWLLEEHQLAVEPSGAAPVAALRRSGALLKEQGIRSVAVVITGRIVNRERYLRLIQEAVAARDA